MSPRRFALLPLILAAISCGKRPPGEPLPPLTLTIDSALSPVPASLSDDGRRGVRPLAAVRDPAGVVNEFIANEVVFAPRSAAELNAFLARYSGTIVGDDRVPAPPAQLGIQLDSRATQPTEYAIRIDASGTDYANLGDTPARAGFGGPRQISSEAGARLLAVAIRETADGRAVSPNFVFHPDAVLRQTRERPNGASFDDAFDNGITPPQFPRFRSDGSRASVTAAWQWVAAHGIARRVRVAIIDGGFWLNAAGQPFTAPGDGSDLPAAPVQYDFVGDDFIAGAMNPAACTGGSACPWHGNGSASVAAGIVNNSAAAAGTGGTVSDPILLHTDIRDKVQRNRAVRTAVLWRADVISMSFSGPCGFDCRQFETKNDTSRGYREAVSRGVALVASAGNNGDDVGAENFVHPCILDGIICVGWLTDNGNTAWSGSNHGAGLDIWAPSNVRAMANQNTSPALSTFGGTSASAPFVAGVAAMIKAINPALGSEQVRNLLRDTAWTDSPDGKVSHYVNAYEAVRRASGGVLPPDRFEANNTPETARVLNPGQHDDLNLHDAADRDYYRISLGSHARVVLDNVYADSIGSPYVDFSKADACGGATEVSKQTMPNRRTFTYDATPGDYLIRAAAGRVLPYDLGISTTATPLGRDSFEGVPNNDAFDRAFALGSGSGAVRPATVLPAGDLDFYRINSTGTIFNPKVGGVRFVFAILSADMPVSVDLYDAGRNLLQTMSSSPDCKTAPSFTLASGAFFIRVRAASAGSYTFAVGARHESGILYDMRSVWRLLLDPSGPVTLDLHSPRVRYAFTRDRGGPGALDLIGAGLRAALFDVAGNQLSEGQVDGREGGLRQRIPLTGTIPGETYVLQIERDIGLAPGPGMRLPGARAQLAMATGK